MSVWDTTELGKEHMGYMSICKLSYVKINSLLCFFLVVVSLLSRGTLDREIGNLWGQNLELKLGEN